MQVFLSFVPALLSGILLGHVLWPERTFWAVALKLFLGMGLGMGLRSLLYFLYLFVLPGRHLYLYVDLLVLALLVACTIVIEGRAGAAAWSMLAFPKLSTVQRIAALVAVVVVIVSLLSTANYLLRRRQGDWDAWMMYNRAARFLYKDQVHWLGSFSPLMDPLFHADYPLLLAGNIVAGWDSLGRDSAAVPMLQSALFSIACLGLFASSLASLKSVGQAALGVTILWGLPVFVNEGARQMADVPMAFFILGTTVLLARYALRAQPGLLVLAGLTAGLGAWTKNEGAVLVAGAGLAVLYLLLLRRDWRILPHFAAGLALPLITLLSFRLFIAPSGDILSAAQGGSLAQVLDPSRHGLILRHMWGELLAFGAWGIPALGLGILPVLLLYGILFHRHGSSAWGPALRLGLIILLVQAIGYYAAYLVSPYELSWHLNYSSTRIVLQVFPLLAFLVLASTLDLETLFSRNSLASTE